MTEFSPLHGEASALALGLLRVLVEPEEQTCRVLFFEPTEDAGTAYIALQTTTENTITTVIDPGFQSFYSILQLEGESLQLLYLPL